MTTTWSASAIASSRSWVTKMTDGRGLLPQRRAARSDMIALVCTSSAPNGSSISRIDGSLISAAARLTRLRMPPESWCGWWSSKPARPTRRSQSRALACAALLRHAAEERPHGHVAEHRLPRQQRVGLEHEAGARGDPGRPAGRRPATRPALGRSSPATMVSVVDLPHPVGPTTAQNCPGSTTRLTSRRAVKAVPAGVRNRLVTPVSSIPASSFRRRWAREGCPPGPGGPLSGAPAAAPADRPLATLVK